MCILGLFNATQFCCRVILPSRISKSIFLRFCTSSVQLAHIESHKLGQSCFYGVNVMTFCTLPHEKFNWLNPLSLWRPCKAWHNGVKIFLVCLFVYSRSVQLQSDRHFCYGAYIQINLYHIQVHKHTWQRVLARKRVSRPVEEWSEAHF